ncbi:hypothetical protein BDV32DRAFT_146480 [Aspergillus pseudonomiae]|uniref:Uncharacterized protein n=1 Tax=Aspergillus pseudonomiae TaxID=1506151 RepID=A0A5N7DPZ2_9EURO|nr:uncharacterized protein BDV37DRAFT_279016 [Aspergillus pseudonomiae]KAB8263664.1 hypothetical protein BDV32DRAFT_146480 [Aspergillus pseudonomiae]KAE8408530.1 hypothetical protein BDV37DRAFT_279016 [Aspergillus pseudonomiae]
MTAHGSLKGRGGKLDGLFHSEEEDIGAQIKVLGSLSQSIDDFFATDLELHYENVDDLNGSYTIDSASSYAGPNDVHIAAKNNGGKTVSILGPIGAHTPSKKAVTGTLRLDTVVEY